ncbi:MAG: hypothetical protein K2K97_02785 [Muribaculaceae bacterium]|nr:hypothetical protein [Muribaculaceae bacterium]
MTRIIITLVILMSGVFSAYAQIGLEIDKIFSGRYSADPRVTETFMSGKNKYLIKNNLTVFASFKGPSAVYSEELQRLVLADGATAVGKNVRYKNGKLYFAFYILKPVKAGQKSINRYLYYLNMAPVGGTNVLVVYLEGSASEKDVSSLIKGMANKENRKTK